MNKEKLFNKQDNLRKKLEDNKELITWTNKLFKKLNLLIITVLIGTTILTIPLILFFTDLFPVSIAVNQLLPLGVTGFICTMTTGGILVSTNIILLSSKLILKLVNKNITRKLDETNILILKNSRSDIEQKKQIKEKENSPYEYQYKTNFVLKDYPSSKPTTNKRKVKVRTKN